MSSTKLELHNTLHCCQRSSQPQPMAACTETLMMFGLVVLQIHMWIDRHIHHNTPLPQGQSNKADALSSVVLVFCVKYCMANSLVRGAKEGRTTTTATTTTNHFMAFWTLSGTTWMSQYQKVHCAIFWIFWCKMKITQVDAPTIRMDCHPIQTNCCPHLYHPHHFYAGYPSLFYPPNLSWLGKGTKYAGLHAWWLG